MSDESRFTLKIGVIMSLVSSIVVCVFTVLWLHQTAITVLQTNQANVLQCLLDLKTVPAKLAEMNIKIESVDQGLKDHRRSFQENIAPRKVER